MLLLLFFILPVFFMWRVFVLGEVAFPGDLLVGAYYPWFENIPVKNPLISDVFSQIFAWKYLIIEAYKNLHIPLWNQFTFSGYPLLANFHSGALYPLNALLLGDFITGWNLLLYSQFVIAGVGMYFFLRQEKYIKLASLIAAVSFAFSGFGLIWWQVVHAGHVLAWLPWGLLVISRRRLRIWPIILFLVVTAGHFQGSIYFLALSVLFAVYKRINLFPWVVVGLLLASPQILPTLELAGRSVRANEKSIAESSFGLLPIQHLATIIAPDFFGNVTTYNYWGAHNYQETAYYVGLLGALAVISAIWQYKKIYTLEKWFLVMALLSLLLAFDGPIGRLIYWLNIPALSTSAAGRVLMVFAFASNVLLTGFITRIRQFDYKKLIQILIVFIALLAIGGLSGTREQSVQILRNLIFPGMLIMTFILCWFFRHKKFIFALLFLIVIVDLFRFGWKYNPFVNRDLVFPDSEETEYLRADNSFFRFDRENGPIIPSNTWEMYGLRSASGYDPVTLQDYLIGYQKILNGNPKPGVSRYAALDRFSTEAMGEYGIKYLLIRNEKLEDYDLQDWKIEKTFPKTTVFENPDYKGLAYLDNPGEVIINTWSADKIDLTVESESAQTLTIATNYYPGWKATIDNISVPIARNETNFQQVEIHPGLNKVVLSYLPVSFYLGLLVSSIVVLVLGYKRYYRV